MYVFYGLLNIDFYFIYLFTFPVSMWLYTKKAIFWRLLLSQSKHYSFYISKHTCQGKYPIAVKWSQHEYIKISQ